MTERLLQFIWQFQYFNKTGLTTSSGEDLLIIFPGQWNTNQGPDFINARISIGNTVWAGSIELHVRTSDWNRHKHTGDENYKNVILHVVWENDMDEAGDMPLLEIKTLVAKLLLKRYEALMGSSAFVPCAESIHNVKEITWKGWKERLLAERLIRKAKLIETYLRENNYHWEETFWWLLARNFGMKVNADAFEAIARSVPINLLAKNKNQIHHLEALLLGQAGLLENDFEEEYPKLLKREYKFLVQKYHLRPINIPLFFLRMRPGNFPSIRLAQLAMLAHTSAHLFSRIKEASSAKEVREWFDVAANDYWHYHYRLGEVSSYKKKNLGDPMIASIIINTVVPVLFAYGNYKNEKQYKEKALEWLEYIQAEKNAITSGFSTLKISNKNAWDSQALIELKNEYCNKKKCLDCAVGNAILKN